MKATQVRLGILGLGAVSLPGCTVTVSPGEFSAGITAGVGLYALANVIYAKMRLEDEPSALKRMLAFWVGLPTTFLLFLLVEPTDSWIQRRLTRGTVEDPDGDPEDVRRDFERELLRIRMAGGEPTSPGSVSWPSDGPEELGLDPD